MDCTGLAAYDNTGALKPYKFTRRSPDSNDVVIKILYCGICHSDLHQIRNDWYISKYPMVPGHEIVGVVTQAGSEVLKFKTGDRVGVGCLVDSCRSCPSCNDGQENYCLQNVQTYNHPLPDGSYTLGGYCTKIVVDERFVVSIPENLPLDKVAPLLCAGITVFSPMKFYGMTEEGKSLGVVGLGGLGHMAVKFGKAFGLKVTVISTSPSKEQEAKEVLGADGFILSKDEKQLQAAMGTLDYIVDTVAASHDLAPLLSLLKLNGKMVLVGIPEKPYQLNPMPLLYGRRLIGGSLMGGLKETQEMMEFCGKHNVVPVSEKVSMDVEAVNKALERLGKSDVKYRFVIDIGDCN